MSGTKYECVNYTAIYIYSTWHHVLVFTFLYMSSVTDSIVPMPPLFCSLVCVEYNTWKRKSGEKQRRPGNEAKASQYLLTCSVQIWKGKSLVV